MNNKYALGQTFSGKSGIGVLTEPTSPEEKIHLLEKRLEYMTKAFYAAKRALADKKGNQNAYEDAGMPDVNKHGIPLNASFFGTTRGIPHVLYISNSGSYFVNNKEYLSLSAAAEAVSGVRRSGWTFWKLPDGRTIKEVYRKNHV